MNRLCLLALLCAGSCQKPKELTSAPLVTKGITGSPVGNGTWNISIDWAAIQAMIPRGCVIAGNPEGVPSGYVLRKGSPEYWCNPKWGRKKTPKKTEPDPVPCALPLPEERRP